MILLLQYDYISADLVGPFKTCMYLRLLWIAPNLLQKALVNRPFILSLLIVCL